jgi:hypothetical protein
MELPGYVPARAGTALALVSLALLGGCGGGSTSSGSGTAAPATSTAQPISQSLTSESGGATAQLISRADAICARANAEIAAAKPESASTSEIIRLTPGHVALERKALSELRGMSPPAPLQAAWRRILANRTTLANQLEALVTDAKSNNGTAIKALTAAKARVHKILLETAQRAGFKDCGQVG